MNPILALLPLVVASAACRTGELGSGHSATETREVTSFDEIRASGAYRLDIRVGPVASVRLSGDDNLLERVQTRVENGRLDLRVDGTIRPERPLVVTVTTPALTRLHASGAVDADISGVHGARFRTYLSGASHLRIDGEVGSLDLTCSGATRVQAQRLIAKYVGVQASGAARISIYAEETLEADLSGASVLLHHGQPRAVSTETSGASFVRAADATAGRSAPLSIAL